MNSNIENRNSKQIQISKIESTKSETRSSKQIQMTENLNVQTNIASKSPV
jgi:hypothetical protein